MSVATSLRLITVSPIVFRGKGVDGDFDWMRNQAAHANTLFIIMENFIDSIREDAEAGGGTAILRPLCLYHQPDSTAPVRAAGVPTGWSTETQGFSRMDNDVKHAIDLAFERIVIMLDSTLKHINQIIFSTDKDAIGMIGTGIFKKTVGADVVAYISRKLIGIPNQPVSKMTLDLVRLEEYKLLRTALLADQIPRLQNKLRAALKRAAPPMLRRPDSGAQTTLTGWKRGR